MNIRLNSFTELKLIFTFFHVYNLRLNDLFGQPFIDNTFVFRVFSDKTLEFDSMLRVEALSDKQKADDFFEEQFGKINEDRLKTEIYSELAEFYDYRKNTEEGADVSNF